MNFSRRIYTWKGYDQGNEALQAEGDCNTLAECHAEMAEWWAENPPWEEAQGRKSDFARAWAIMKAAKEVTCERFD